MIRRAPIARRTGLTRTGPLRGRSARRARSERAYARLRAELLADRPPCEVGPVVRLYDREHRCAGEAVELHHRRQRSSGGLLADRHNVVETCRPCHEWIGAHPSDAHAGGLLIRPCCAEWPDLGGETR